MASAKPTLGANVSQPSFGNRFIDLSGKTIGRLFVIRFAEIRRSAKGRQYFWLCRCECGLEKLIDGSCLRRKSTISCGCCRSKTHGLSDSPLYGIWQAIKQRCTNRKHKNWPDYGGRGITVCDRWKNSFEAFYADVGERPTPLHTIERIDNEREYSPANCKWATRAEQNENTRQTRLITFNKVTLSLGKWASRIGIDRRSLGARIDRLGWSLERALSTPVRQQQRRKR